MKKTTIIIITLFILIIFFFISKSLFFLTAIITLNIIFSLLISSWAGIEIVTCSTIIIGITCGSLAGVFMGITGRLIEAFLAKKTFSLPVTLPLYIILGYVAGMFSGSNTFLTGTILSISYIIFSSLLTILILGGKVGKTIIFCLINIPINILLFINLANIT